MTPHDIDRGSGRQLWSTGLFEVPLGLREQAMCSWAMPAPPVMFGQAAVPIG